MKTIHFECGMHSLTKCAGKCRTCSHGPWIRFSSIYKVAMAVSLHYITRLFLCYIRHLWIARTTRKKICFEFFTFWLHSIAICGNSFQIKIVVERKFKLFELTRVKLTNLDRKLPLKFYRVKIDAYNRITVLCVVLRWPLFNSNRLEGTWDFWARSAW